MSISFKFFPIKDLFYSVFPTVGTYLGYLKDAPLFNNFWISIGIGLVASIILATLFFRENVKAYKKSLAEILAIGYFGHFSGRLGKLLKSKVPVKFSFPDGSLISYDTNKIRVEIGMPRSFSALCAYCEKVESTAEIVYVREESQSEPFWLRATREDDYLVIYEYPRTLFSLSKYLKEEFSNREKADRNSVRIYDYFKEKINQLRIENANEICEDRLIFATV